MDTKLIQNKISEFAKERDWQQFHTPKNISMALTVEAAELMEIFQWLTPEQALSLKESEKIQSVREEVADVAVYLLRLCDLLEIDLETAIHDKMIKNAIKYPVDKSRGSAKKYDEL